MVIVGFIAVVGAILALILLLAMPLIVNVLNNTIGNLPFPFGALGGYIVSGFTSLSAAFTVILDDAVVVVAQFIQGIAVNVWGFVAATVNTIESVASSVGVLGARLNIDVGNLQSNINAVAHDLQANVDAIAHDLQANINAEVAAAESIASAAVTVVATNLVTAEGNLQNNINAVAHDLQANLNTVASDLQANINRVAAALAGLGTVDLSGVEGTIANDLQQALAAAQAAQAAAIATAGQLATVAATGATGALEQVAHDLVLGPWQGLLGEVEPIVANLPGAVTQAIPGLGQLSPALPISIGGILAAVVPAVAAIGAEVNRCVVPNCDSMVGLGRLWGFLQADATLLLIGALLAGAAADPAAVVTDVVDTLGPIASGISAGVREVVGV